MKKETSLPGRRKGFTVQPSPLNQIKLELGLILLVGLLFAGVVGRMVHDPGLQLIPLLVYGFAGAGLVVVRARGAMRRFRSKVDKGVVKGGEE